MIVVLLFVFFTYEYLANVAKSHVEVAFTLLTYGEKKIVKISQAFFVLRGVTD